MKQSLNMRRVVVRTVVIVVALMVVCAACNLLAPMVLPMPSG